MIVAASSNPRVVPPPAIQFDARPLYIVATADTYVSLDGPALAVSREERAQLHFPLQRIARVYSSTGVHWSTSALLACAERGIAVVFVDAQGEVQARLLGRPGERDELLLRWREFLLLPQAPDMYQHWLRGMRARVAWWAAVRVQAPASMRDPRRARLWIEQLALRLTGRRAAEKSRQWLRALAYHWMEQHLHDLGFGASTELGQAGEPALARDLAELLMWYLEPPRIGWLRRRYHAALARQQPLLSPTHADLVRLFESRAARVAKRGRDLTGSLHRWLVSEG
ncbi:MAG: hypothetical protein EA400_07530 [Chromatiaceae bacterium]|nr:MAG: hypothetical protein EA400_07530 [Chromatiaceae bacterium]